MKSWVVHYKNKYPGAQIRATEESFDVYVGNDHKLSLRKSGAGGWSDVSEEMGCSEKHDLSPIPKDARIFKVLADGKIGKDERAEEREEFSAEVSKKYGGKIPSVDELQKAGIGRFDEKQRLEKN